MSDQKLERLKKLFEIANDGLSRDEFLKSFKSVVNQVLKIEATVLEKINKIIAEFKQEHKELTDETVAEVEKIKDELLAKADKMFEEQKQNLAFIHDKVKRIKEGIDGKDGRDGATGLAGQDGKDADETKIISEILKKIVIPRVDESKLKALDERLDALLRMRRLGGGGFSKIAMESKFIDDETPTGIINDVNKIFTLANTPNPPASVKVFVNGARMRVIEDYTLSGKTITFITAPPTTSIILVDYRH